MTNRAIEKCFFRSTHSIFSHWTPHCLGLKKLFVSCNPTLTSFYPALPTPNQHKTCIKHTFLTKKIIPPQKKKKITNLPTLFFFRPLQETNNFFSRRLIGFTGIFYRIDTSTTYSTMTPTSNRSQY